MKAFLIDLDKCVGCHACQIACKDEHCGNCWLPYAESQPEVGQFWLKVTEFERGANSHVIVTYQPTMCQHCQEAPCMDVAKDGAVYRRDDGLVLIDPEKAKGQKAIVTACPYHAVFWNDELNIPQKCTGCAHLIDRGWPISVPRCMDNCHVDAILFGEETELDLEGTEFLHPEYGTKPRVYYRGLPKRFVSATVYDPAKKNVIVGATCTLSGDAGTFSAVTNMWGDFWIHDVPAADWTLTIEAGGKSLAMPVSTTEKDVGLPDVALS